MAEWNHMSDDPHGVKLPMDEIIDRAIRWKTTLFANVGSAIPERYCDDYLRLHRAMMGIEKLKSGRCFPFAFLAPSFSVLAPDALLVKCPRTS